jgi:hypothetical protein
MRWKEEPPVVGKGCNEERSRRDESENGNSSIVDVVGCKVKMDI